MVPGVSHFRFVGCSDMAESCFSIGKRIDLPGQFAEPVVPESVRPLGDDNEGRVRNADSTPALGTADSGPRVLRVLVTHLDHAKREVISARHYDIPFRAIEAATQSHGIVS
jgi:hypothetical protein